MSSNSVLFIGAVWFLAAVLAAASGRLQVLRPPAPQLVLLGLTALLCVSVLRLSSAHRWVNALPIRALVALHLIRLVAGSAFLLFYRWRELPAAFAVPSGWGDVTVAVLAAGLLVTGPPTTPSRRRLYSLWNVIGVVDILFVVATAARIGMADPAGMGALLRLPLSLLPTFFVPLIIVSHLVLALRLSGHWPAPEII